MNSLTELKSALQRANVVQVIAFNGHVLTTSVGDIAMCDGVYSLDGNNLSKKQLNNIIQKGVTTK